MADNGVIDLGVREVRLPERIAIDANVLATRLIPPRTISPAYHRRLSRVRAFFSTLEGQAVRGVVTSIALNEFIHLAIKARVARDLPTYAA